MLEEFGAGGTKSFLAKIYPVFSGFLLQDFLKAEAIYRGDRRTVCDVRIRKF